jgi:amino acid transporter
MLAEIGQFPPIFGSASRLGRHAGLLITGGLTLVVANFVDLSAIASVGSACSLLVFFLVGIAGYRKRAETGASAWLILLGLAVTATVLGFFAVDTLQNAPETFTAIVAIAALAVVLDFLWKRHRRVAAPTASPRVTPTA